MFCFRQGLYSCWYGHVQNTVRFVNAVLKVRINVSCGKKRNVAPLTDKLALDGGKWSASSPGRVIHTYVHTHIPWIHKCVIKKLPLRQGAGSAPEAVWELRWSENYFAPEGNRTPDHPAPAVLSPLWQNSSNWNILLYSRLAQTVVACATLAATTLSCGAHRLCTPFPRRLQFYEWKEK